MPVPVLNAAARLMCSHGGQVEVIPKQTLVMAGAMPVLMEGDLIGSPIAGCTLPPTPATKPCTLVASEIALPGVGASMMAMCEGRPLLLEGVTGITDSVPPGTIMVVSPGQATVMA